MTERRALTWTTAATRRPAPPRAATTEQARTCMRAAAGKRTTRAAVLSGLVVGALQAASPLAFWWLEPSTVLALSLAVVAAIYIGFAVADGRPKVIAVECAVAGGFVVLASTAVTATVWILVLGFTAHGFKDAWQQRSHYVANTRWWPPFCAAVDWLLAAILAVEIAAGVHLR